MRQSFRPTFPPTPPLGLLGAALAGALLAWIPTHAAAQTRTGGSLDAAIERRISAELSLGAWEPTLARDIVVSALSAYPGGRVALWRDGPSELGTIELEGSLRGFFGETYDDVGTAHYFSLGSSTLALMIGWTDRRSVRVRAGPGVVVPFAMLGGARESVEDMTYYGRATLGFWDPWDGFVRGPAVIARGDFDVRYERLIAGADFGAGASFWALGENDGGLVEVPVAVAYYQVGAYVGAEVIDWLALGARVQVVGWSDGGGARRLERRPAQAQASVVPFARLALRPWFVEARGTLNLGEPEGVGSRSLVWSVRAVVGVELGR